MFVSFCFCFLRKKIKNKVRGEVFVRKQGNFLIKKIAKLKMINIIK